MKVEQVIETKTNNFLKEQKQFILFLLQILINLGPSVVFSNLPVPPVRHYTHASGVSPQLGGVQGANAKPNEGGERAGNRGEGRGGTSWGGGSVGVMQPEVTHASSPGSGDPPAVESASAAQDWPPVSAARGPEGSRRTGRPWGRQASQGGDLPTSPRKRPLKQDGLPVPALRVRNSGFSLRPGEGGRGYRAARTRRELRAETPRDGGLSAGEETVRGGGGRRTRRAD